MKLKVRLQGEIVTVYTDPERSKYTGESIVVCPVSMQDFNTPEPGTVPRFYRREEMPTAFPGYEIEYLQDPSGPKEPPVAKSKVTDEQINKILGASARLKQPEAALAESQQPSLAAMLEEIKKIREDFQNQMRAGLEVPPPSSSHPKKREPEWEPYAENLYRMEIPEGWLYLKECSSELEVGVYVTTETMAFVPRGGKQ